MDKAKVVDKIKKLLELAGSPNESEAKLAYSRARDLMAKYCVDVSLEDSGLTPEVVQLPYNNPLRGAAVAEHLPYIALAIGRPFGVYVLITRQHGIKLVGFKLNCELVAYALDSVLNQCQADFRKEFAKYRTITFSTNFWRGVRASLELRFASPAESDSNEVGLTVYDPVKKYMDQFTAGKYQPGLEASGIAGLNAGAQAGASVSIRQGVSSVVQNGSLLS